MKRIESTDIKEEAFIEWLTSFPEEEIIGKVGDPLNCPLSKFIETITGEKYVIGSENIVRTDPDDYTLIPLPVWAQKFVAELDDLKEDFADVNAKETMKALISSRLERYIGLQLAKENGDEV